MKKQLLVAALSISILSACDNQAYVASQNLSKAADNFEITRRIVFFNGITDKYLLSIEGLCSIDVDNGSKKLDVTCKTGPNQYKKHFLGLSDNVSYFSEQIESANADAYHYRVIFRPQTIIPNFEIDLQKGSGQ